MRLASPILVRPIRDLVEQHVEDAALHWMRRQHALGAPHYYFTNHLGEPGGDVGHLDRCATVDAALAEELPNVLVTGASYRGIGIPGCIRQGRRAAAAVMSG